jgi:hypothetical protein
VNDSQAIEQQCRRARDAGTEISDGCARAIVTGWAAGQTSLAASFASTGAVPEPPTALWEEIFHAPTTEGGVRRRVYDTLADADLLAADMLAAYLDHAGPRGGVAGWPAQWVR